MLTQSSTIATRLFGTSVTLLIGVGFEVLALIGASFTHKIWQLFLTQVGALELSLPCSDDFTKAARRQHGTTLANCSLFPIAPARCDVDSEIYHRAYVLASEWAFSSLALSASCLNGLPKSEVLQMVLGRQAVESAA